MTAWTGRGSLAPGLLVALVLAALLPAACLFHRGAREAEAPPAFRPAATISGNYLSARYARARRDDGNAAQFLLAALDKAPHDNLLLSRAYVALLLDGRIDDGVNVARRSIAVDDDAALPRVVLAIDDIRGGRFAEAIGRLDAINNVGLPTFLVPLLKAWALNGKGDYPAAMATLEKITAIPMMLPLYHMHAAWISDVAGHPEAAREHVRAVLADQPEPWLRLTELAGNVLERGGQTEQARALYRGFAERQPDTHAVDADLARLDRGGPPPSPEIRTINDGLAEAMFDTAVILARQNNREAALMLARLGLALRPDFPALQLTVANILESFERLPQANAMYAAIDPNATLSWTARMSTARNLDRLDQFDAAEKLLRQLAAERAGDADPLIELGDILRRRERFPEAVVVYDEAAARIGTLTPEHWRLLYARGIALERAKQWPRAEADFLKALELEPDQPFVLNYLGYSWVERGENLEKAEAMIRKAVDMRPNDGYIVDSLGWVLYRLGRFAEAEPYLERAVELRPEDAVINDHLGDVYWATGRRREARFQWQAALSRDPEPELRATIEAKLRDRPVDLVEATPTR